MIKIILFLLIVLMYLPSLSFAELTKKDIEEIRTIVKEEIANVDKRIDLLEKSIDQRFQQIDKRFEQIDKRLEFIQNLIIGMLAVFGGLCGVFVGLLLWDRKTFKDKAKEEAMKELEVKWKIPQWIEAFKELAEKDERLKEILKKCHLI